MPTKYALLYASAICRIYLDLCIYIDEFIRSSHLAYADQPARQVHTFGEFANLPNKNDRNEQPYGAFLKNPSLHDEVIQISQHSNFASLSSC